MSYHVRIDPLGLYLGKRLSLGTLAATYKQPHAAKEAALAFLSKKGVAPHTTAAVLWKGSDGLLHPRFCVAPPPDLAPGVRVTLRADLKHLRTATEVVNPRIVSIQDGTAKLSHPQGGRFDHLLTDLRAV